MKKLLIAVLLLIPSVAFSQVSVKASYQRPNHNWGISAGHYSQVSSWAKYGFEILFHEGEYDLLSIAFIPKLEQWGFNLHAGPKFGIIFDNDANDFSALVGAGYTIIERIELGYRYNVGISKVDGEHLNFGVAYLGINL